jgi:hypothetical protein
MTGTNMALTASVQDAGTCVYNAPEVNGNVIGRGDLVGPRPLGEQVPRPHLQKQDKEETVWQVGAGACHRP